jgi:hypothetical protein
MKIKFSSSNFQVNTTLLSNEWSFDNETVFSLSELVADLQVAWDACYNFDPRTDLYDVINDMKANLTILANDIASTNTTSLECAAEIEATLTVLGEAALAVNDTILVLDLAGDNEAIGNLTESYQSLVEAWQLCKNYDNRTEFVDILAEIKANLTIIGDNMTMSGLSWCCVGHVALSYMAAIDIIDEVWDFFHNFFHFYFLHFLLHFFNVF